MISEHNGHPSETFGGCEDQGTVKGRKPFGDEGFWWSNDLDPPHHLPLGGIGYLDRQASLRKNSSASLKNCIPQCVMSCLWCRPSQDWSMLEIQVGAEDEEPEPEPSSSQAQENLNCCNRTSQAEACTRTFLPLMLPSPGKTGGACKESGRRVALFSTRTPCGDGAPCPPPLISALPYEGGGVPRALAPASLII